MVFRVVRPSRLRAVWARHVADIDCGLAWVGVRLVVPVRRRSFLKQAAACVLGVVAVCFVPGRPWVVGVEHALAPEWLDTAEWLTAVFETQTGGPEVSHG